MTDYPVSVPVTESLKLTRDRCIFISISLENYINQHSKNHAVRVYNYRELAGIIGCDVNIVKEFLRPIGGGSTEITVYNREFGN